MRSKVRGKAVRATVPRDGRRRGCGRGANCPELPLSFSLRCCDNEWPGRSIPGANQKEHGATQRNDRRNLDLAGKVFARDQKKCEADDREQRRQRIEPHAERTRRVGVTGTKSDESDSL